MDQTPASADNTPRRADRRSITQRALRAAKGKIPHIDELALDSRMRASDGKTMLTVIEDAIEKLPPRTEYLKPAFWDEFDKDFNVFGAVFRLRPGCSGPRL